ncbi:MAG: GAF domain-containing protein [Gemmatimonadetes bacterium]|nr:GAF domain-containing protein [Gemmatimonadota bacterium]
MKAPLPHTEAARVAALHEYRILDTLPEPAYDDLTRLASEICRTPIALGTLIDSDRQWFKSRVGLDVAETPRDIAFCAHALFDTELLVVRDTTQDERFADNPFVTAAPRIRFYAGAPLVSHDGQVLGTLCVLDSEPRELTPEQMDALRALARQVMAQLELRRKVPDLQTAVAERERAEAQLRVRAEQGAHYQTVLLDLARSPVTDLESALRMTGASAYLTKPLDVDHFLATVEGFLAGARK